MEAWEIGGLVLLLLLVIGCLVFCCKFARRWRRAGQTMEHRQIGASEIGSRKSAWDADDDDDDAWKVEVEEEVARAKAAEEEEERKRERDSVVAGSTKREREDDGVAYGATSPVLNNWMIHFNDE